MSIREAHSLGARRGLVTTARELRKHPTRSEQLLWEALRDRRLEGHKFRRQARIGHFIADFYCPGQRLVVEVDGGIHSTQILQDKERQMVLESLELRVIRITAEECETDLDGVINRIRRALDSPPDEFPSPAERERGQG